MRIDTQKTIKIDELAFLVRRSSGITWSSLWQVLYYTRLLKYVRREHFPQIKTFYNKFCSTRNLQKLCSLGYLKSPQENIYSATNKVLPILKEAGFVTEILPSETEGTGNINEINNTDIFVKLLKLPTFATLLYPQFKDKETGKPYLKPDALLVQKHEAKRMYKLTFLEIEAKKPDWGTYIDTKRSNYMRLSKDIAFYNYWSSVCLHLNLPKPDINTLGFSVRFIGTIKKEFGYGFAFTNPLLHERS